jgi:hypothetical protein
LKGGSYEGVYEGTFGLLYGYQAVSLHFASTILPYCGLCDATKRLGTVSRSGADMVSWDCDDNNVASDSL